MALNTIQSNNKLIKFRQEMYREYVRANLFSPYMGREKTAIIRVITDLDKGGKMGGQQINVPLLARLNSQGVGAGTLVGNEESQDNYGLRAWVDWTRNAVATKKADENMSSVDLFGEAKEQLVEWGQEKQRDEICDALFALPSEAAPVGLNSNAGQRVNGILFDAATAAQRNTWITDNADRILIGSGNGANLVAGNFASSMANITSGMTLSGALANRVKRSAKKANPRIKPFKVKENGSEWFVWFLGQEQFRDLQNDADIKNANLNARAREGDSFRKNPIFVDGDLLYNGMIFREIPELSIRLPVFYATAGNGGNTQVAPAFMCGQAAASWCWGQMPKPTFRKEDDYGFIRGTGTEMCYGIVKNFKKTIAGNLREWGIFTGFFAAVADN